MHNVTATTPVKLHGFKDKEKDSTKKLQGVCKALVRKWYTYFPWHMLFTLHKCLSSFHPFTHFLYLTNCCQFFHSFRKHFLSHLYGMEFSLEDYTPIYDSSYYIVFISLFFFISPSELWVPCTLELLLNLHLCIYSVQVGAKWSEPLFPRAMY